ncbi:MAG: TonB-dependent receptor plug domain-containing protein [Nibricoccus sp.]
MIRKLPAGGALYAALVSALVYIPSAFGQTPASEPTTTDRKASVAAEDEEEILVLSPFTVEAAEDKDSYRAKSTLAGTRVRTDVNDLPSAISIVTSQFLKDTGAKNSQDLLVYTTSTEVSGVKGNYAGTGGGLTYNENLNLLRPNNATRVRGLAQADNTREFFLTDIPWDGYNTGRVDMQRGPNSILFGAGSPAGIINTSINGATFKNANKYSFRLDQYNSQRHELDINYVLLPKELSLRVTGMDDKSKFEQNPAFNNDRRIFVAGRWDPQIFEGGATSVKANFETGKVMANRPRSLAPIDSITPWFTDMNQLTVNPNTSWNQYGNNPIYPNNTYPWFREAAMGRLFGSTIANYYNAYAATSGGGNRLLYSRMGTVGTGFGINSSGAVDGTISGIPFARPYGIATYHAYAASGWVPGGAFFGNKSLRDPGIFDFYHKLMDGDNKREWQNWKAANLSISQTFFNDRLGFEYAYFGQRYDDGQYAFLNGDQYSISVDLNTHLLDGSPNPNVGRPYVGNSGQYNNSKNYIDRDNWRFTVMGDIRFDDFMQKSLLTRILGRHVLTGLVSQDRKRMDYRNFARWASEPDWAAAQSPITNNANITSGSRAIDWIAYIGPDLRGRNTASGIGLSNVNTIINPVGYQQVRYYDSHWNAPSVNPNDPYTYYENDSSGTPVGFTVTQAENPANYVGWRSGNFRILNADNSSDLESLWTAGSKTRNIISSQAFTWQGYLWDGNIIPVFGWRKDKVSNYNSQAPKDLYGVAIQNYSADSDGKPPVTAEETTKSWGFVIHSPKWLSDKMPGKTRLSFFYNNSQNFQLDVPRGDIFGNLINNPTGKTKDFGIVISTLDDRIVLKVNRYETRMKDATLQADSAGFSSTLYYAWALPYWEATHSLAALDGIATPQRRQGNWGWPWNGIDSDPNRIRTIVTDFFTKFPLSQKFADEYGLGLNVAKMHSNNEADWYLAVPQYGSGSIADGGSGASGLGLQPAYNGTLKSTGNGPVATVDTISKGIEIELTAKPTNNWNLTLNAAKTDAKYTAISPSIVQWINDYTKFLAGDAGLVRLWGGDTFRDAWRVNILAPYSTLTSQVGQQVPEIPEWRLNGISTYAFDRGILKGVYVGGGYRWEGKRVLGYDFKRLANGQKDYNALDANRPFHGPTDEHVDIWLGYSRRLGKKVDWNIQLNIRNLTEHTKQVPVTINPDGQVATTRIAEGQTWQLTNTFNF